MHKSSLPSSGFGGDQGVADRGLAQLSGSEADVGNTSPRSAESLASCPESGSVRRPWSRFEYQLLIIAVAISLTVAFFALGRSRTLNFHETLLTVTARQMMSSGDWIVPRFAGQPRLAKPPLGYWSAIVCSLPTGELTEVTGRLPSALASLGLVALVGCWCGRWYGREAGLCAALIQSVSVYHLTYAREATVDMQLCLMMTLALFVAAVEPEGESKGRSQVRWAFFWTLLGLTWMAKFHFGPALVLAPLIALWWYQRRFDRLWRLVNLPGWLVFAAMALVWPWLVLREIPDAWEVWRLETVGRALGELVPQPFWYFGKLIPWMAIPAIPFVVFTARESWQKIRRDGDEQQLFLWTWFVVQIGVISLSSNKHPNYCIPALPALSILAGPALSRFLKFVRRPQDMGDFRGTVLVTVLASTAIGIGAAVAIAKWPSVTEPVLIIAAAAIAGLGTTFWLCHFQRWQASGMSLSVTGLCILMGVLGWVQPARDYRQPAARFSQEIREKLADGQEVCVYKLMDASVLFYLNESASREENWKGLQARLQQTPELLVVTEAKQVARLKERGAAQVVDVLDPDETGALERTPDLVLLRLSLREEAATADKSTGPGGNSTMIASPPRDRARQ